tara:strand:- start:3640 stop:3837 length:198 start_codon:yes stop_codon:yes gene_type:complete
MEYLYIMNRYKQNLRVSREAVYSYNTKVATINHLKQEVKQLGWWSVTTQKHINYVARVKGYELVK